MAIKKLPPESIETFSLVLHPKRRYSTRLPPSGGPPAPARHILTEGADFLTTEGGDLLITES